MDEAKRILSDQEKENLLSQSRRANSPLQLKEIARSGGIELSDEMADMAYVYIQKGNKLNLQDLDQVSAGENIPTGFVRGPMYPIQPNSSDGSSCNH